MIFDQEIEEIHKIRKMYNNGKLSYEQLMGNMKAFDQTHKRMATKIQAYAVAIKAGRSIKNCMERDSLIGNGAIARLSINDEAIEVEMVKCIGLNDQLITRSECLDSSGSSKFVECLCDNGKTTKGLLLPI